MAEETIFDEGNTETPVEPTIPLPQGDYLNALVGEDKKFKSVEDLAKGKLESDQFIQRLQQENEGIREELKTRVTLQEFMDQMNQQAKQVPQKAAEETPSAFEQAPAEPQKSGISPEDLESLLEKKLSEREQISNSQRNLKQVTAKLNEVFGPSYISEVKKKAAELGVGEKFFDNLAKTQPNAFLKLMDVNESTPVHRVADGSPPASQVNTSANTSNFGSSTKRNMAYYDKIRESDPNRYWSSSVQNEMHNEALKQGEEFFN
jgi:hypothetical protein